MTFDDLVKQALVGTARAAPELPEGDGPLAAALAPLRTSTPEQQLLGAAVVVSAYECCGRLPAPGGDRPEPAPADARPAASRRAGDLLAQILALPQNETRRPLLREWVDLAARAGKRLPHRLLPALFDYAAGHRPLRQQIADAADARGAWLMAQNPRWQFAAAEGEDVERIWQIGNVEQRVSVLSRLRESDPAAARALVQSTWAQDAADERARFVDALRSHLSPEDEPLLESALDDRSKQVRAAAADVLSRLAGSAFVKRMTDRAESMLKLDAGKGRLLKTLKPATIDVTLPPETPDPSWVRDGIDDKPRGKSGVRQSIFAQVLGCVPPTHWSAAWNLDARSCAAAARGEFAAILLQAWSAAAERHPDAAWAAALLDRAVKQADERADLRLLRGLQADDQRRIVTDLFGAPALPWNLFHVAAVEGDFPLDARGGENAIAYVERAVRTAQQTNVYTLRPALTALALRLPTPLLDEAGRRWAGPEFDAYRPAFDAFFPILRLRRDIQREFAT